MLTLNLPTALSLCAAIILVGAAIAYNRRKVRKFLAPLPPSTGDEPPARDVPPALVNPSQPIPRGEPISAFRTAPPEKGVRAGNPPSTDEATYEWE